MFVTPSNANIRKTLLLSCLIAGLFWAAATSSATVVSAHFSSVSANSQNGEYTYPYYISLDGSNVIPMMCDDFFHGSGVGDTWLANVTMLSSSDLSNTRFGDYTMYVQAAFLLHELKSDNTAEWGNINWAVWKLFNPQLNPGSGPTGTLGPEYWYDLAQSVDLSTVNVADIAIVTPLDAHGQSGDQEFLFMTPEPGALLLVGTGLLGLWTHRKRFV